MTLFSTAYFVSSFVVIPKSAIHQVVGPAVFPRAVSFLMLLISVIYLVQQMRGIAKEADEKRAAIIGADEKVETKADIRTMLIMIGIMIAYAFLFEPLGYAVATFLSFMAGLLVLNRKHLLRDTIVGLVASFGMYFAFTILLRVQLPAGVLILFGL